MIFYSKNNRKHLTIAVKYINDGENRISFIKQEGEIIGTIYSVQSNEIEICVESLSLFESDGTNVVSGHKKVASKLKRVNTKIISIHCDNQRLALAIVFFFKESIFLMKNNNLIFYFIMLILIIN